jgi:hypothetical protein
MSDIIPFVPGKHNYELGVLLSGKKYIFDVHWNDRDQAWYFDLRNEDNSPILLGVKVVIDVVLGRRSTHEFFTTHMLVAVDTSGKRIDAGIGDLGGRVQVLHVGLDDALGGR